VTFNQISLPNPQTNKTNKKKTFSQKIFWLAKKISHLTNQKVLVVVVTVGFEFPTKTQTWFCSTLTRTTTQIKLGEWRVVLLLLCWSSMLTANPNQGNVWSCVGLGQNKAIVLVLGFGFRVGGGLGIPNTLLGLGLRLVAFLLFIVECFNNSTLSKVSQD